MRVVRGIVVKRVAVVDAYATLNHMATENGAEQPEVRLNGAAIADMLLTRCSAIAERPRCRVCYSFRQK